MTLTPQELEARRERIGASDVAAIMGVPTFAGVNAWTVWADKCGMVEGDKKAPWLDAGNRLEPWLLDWAERELGALERNVVVYDPDGSPIASTLDARTVEGGVPVEAKTSGVLGPLHGSWGEPGTDEVPDGYILQVQTQILCTGADLAHLFALLGGRGKVRYELRPEPRLIATIRQVSTDFWERYVVPRRDPRADWADRLRDVHHIHLTDDPCAPVLEVARRLRRESGKTVDADGEAEALVLAWEDLRQARLDLEKSEKAVLAQVLTMLGDADAARLPDGRLFAYHEQAAAPVIDRDAMKADGIWERYSRPNTARVARLKKS